MKKLALFLVIAIFATPAFAGKHQKPTAKTSKGCNQPLTQYQKQTKHELQFQLEIVDSAIEELQNGIADLELEANSFAAHYNDSSEADALAEIERLQTDLDSKILEKEELEAQLNAL